MQKTIKMLLFIFLLSFSVNSFAQENVQEKCFNDLVQNVWKINVWWTWSKEINNLNYSDINFSKYYKNISSFGIDIDEPLFEMRLYSFWEQTGYIHPPYSPYPTYTESDKWEETAKEYIVAEEYIVNPEWEKIFLSCSFMKIESDNLMNVTSENYLYDGDIISVIQSNENDTYKVWYNENVSYDHYNNPFVTWKRLFIYPEETKNDYFNRYDILEAFPTNEVEDLLDLSFRDNKWEILHFKDDNMINWESRIYIMNTDWEYVNFLWSKYFAPIEKEWLNKVFPLNSYYQSIEDTFPEFWEKLSLRWILPYNTIKKLLATKDDTNFAHIWNTVLDTREITKYSLEKEEDSLEEEIEFYEKNLNNINNIKEEADKLLINFETKKEEEQNQIEQISQNELNEEILLQEKNNNEKSTIKIIVLNFLFVLWFLLLIFVWVKLYKKIK